MASRRESARAALRHQRVRDGRRERAALPPARQFVVAAAVPLQSALCSTGALDSDPPRQSTRTRSLSRSVEQLVVSLCLLAIGASALLLL